MAASKVPAYRRRSDGRASVRINGRDIYLGPVDSAESWTEYGRVISEWNSSASRPGRVRTTVSELCRLYLEFARGYFVKNGRPTPEIFHLQTVTGILERDAGNRAASEFGPRLLQSVQRQLVEADYARKTINDHVNRIRRIWKWAVAQELVDESAWRALTAVGALKKGRSDARETEPIRPVSRSQRAAVHDHVSPQVWAMIGLQYLTGCRPGEIVIMRGCDLSRNGQVWEYRPVTHKLEHMERNRIIGLGPKAQEVLIPWLRSDPDEYLFQPKEWRSEVLRRLTTTGRSRKPKGSRRLPGEHYTPNTYRNAIHRACDKAGVDRWSPNQLRHSRATELRELYGIESAQIVLGHSDPQTTQIYAEQSLEKMRKIMQQVG